MTTREDAIKEALARNAAIHEAMQDSALEVGFDAGVAWMKRQHPEIGRSFPREFEAFEMEYRYRKGLVFDSSDGAAANRAALETFERIYGDVIEQVPES